MRRSAQAGRAPATRRALSVSCRAQPAPANEAALSRRAVFASGLVAGALFVPRRALALIPDEEDEELLERAKANKAKRLAADREVTRTFLKEEGLKNRELDQELIPVQKAVTQLAKSGANRSARPAPAMCVGAGCQIARAAANARTARPRIRRRRADPPAARSALAACTASECACNACPPSAGQQQGGHRPGQAPQQWVALAPTTAQCPPPPSPPPLPRPACRYPAGGGRPEGRRLHPVRGLGQGLREVGQGAERQRREQSRWGGGGGRAASGGQPVR
jgi:hypothetical protein